MKIAFALPQPMAFTPAPSRSRAGEQHSEPWVDHITRAGMVILVLLAGLAWFLLKTVSVVAALRGGLQRFRRAQERPLQLHGSHHAG